MVSAEQVHEPTPPNHPTANSAAFEVHVAERARLDAGKCTPRPRTEVDAQEVIAAHTSEADARSLASLDRPPSEKELAAKMVYAPLSLPVLALLAPASIFGVLARLGLQGLVDYDGRSVFPLAYVQTMGCFIMGLCIGLKEPLGELYVRFSTFRYSGA